MPRCSTATPSEDRWRHRPPCARARDVHRYFARNHSRASAYRSSRFFNEAIFSARAFAAHLPHSIEAVYYVTSKDGCRDPHDRAVNSDTGRGRCEHYARRFHALLLAHFGESAARIPLLGLDLLNWTAPFAPG